jgi:hypothetical protein
MPLLPFRRRDEPPEREYAKPPVPAAAAGVDGDQYSDYYDALAGGADINPVWTGRNKYPVIEEMRKTDPCIHSLLWMSKLPVRQAEWSFLPFGDGNDPVDRLICEACNAQFGLADYEGWLDLSHDELLMQDMLCLDFGSMFEEITWGDPITFTPLDDGASEPRLIRPIARLAPRYPATVERVTSDKRTGHIISIEQDRPGARPIPGDSIVVYILDREADWYGTSMLRYCWGAWRMKKTLLISSAIGWDRYASGIPLVRYPLGKEEEAKKIGRSVRVHERAYVTLEGPPPEQGGAWDFEIISGAQSLPDPINLLRHHDVQIAQAGLQAFKELGNTATGSRAVADVTQMPYWQAVTAFARSIAQHRRKYCVRRFVDVNFGSEYQTPELKVSKIEAQDVFTLSQIISNLSSANLTFTDRDTQDDIRDRLELRHLPEQTAADISGAVDQLPGNVGLAATMTVPTEGTPITAPP